MFEAAELDGIPAIVMELVPGGSLRDRIDEEGRLPPREAVDRTLEALEGLEVAWRAGILHRDVKPSNIFLDEQGRAKVGDFGIARDLEREAAATVTGAFIGTPRFASPEQVRGRDLDERSDLYSLGATLYSQLAGEDPFRDREGGDLVGAILTEDPDPLPAGRGGVPRGLTRVVRKLMAKDPADRPPTAAEARALLVPWSSEGSTAAAPSRRLLAGVADWLVALFSSIFSFTLLPWNPVGNEGHLELILFQVLYFGLFEGLTGSTPGKALMGFRVRGTKGEKIGPGRGLLRALLFVLATSLVTADYLAQHWGPNGFLLWLGCLSGLFLTMRPGNGWAALHDLATGTRVRKVRRAGTTTLAERLTVEAPKPPQRLGPERGPFRLARELWSGRRESLFEAWDPVLRRRVWIHQHDGASPLPDPWAGRLRRLQEGSEDDLLWTAWEAPAGSLLATALRERNGWDWERALPVLQALLEEIHDLEEAGVDLSSADESRLYLDVHDRLLVLPFPLDPAVEPGRGLKASGGGADLFRRALLHLLEGRLRSEAAWVPQAPLPLRVRKTIRAWEKDPEKTSTVDALQTLRELSSRPARLTTRQRVSPMALVVMLPALYAGLVLLSLLASVANPSWRDLLIADHYLEIINGHGAYTPRRREAAEILLAGVWQRNREGPFHAVLGLTREKELRIQALSEEVGPVKTGALEEARALWREESWSLWWKHEVGDLLGLPAALSVLYLPFLALGGILLTPLLREPPLYQLCRIHLTTEQGEPVPRRRALLRALVSWAPVLPVPLYWAWRALQKHTPWKLDGAVIQSLELLAGGIPEELVVWVLSGPALLLFLGWLLGFLHPERHIPDRVAGTRPVPR